MLGSAGDALCSGVLTSITSKPRSAMSERTYASGFVSWTTFRKLVGRDQYLESDADE